MAFHKITKPFNRDEPNVLYFGYKWEVRDDGVYADVIDELVDGEIAAGRILPNIVEFDEEAAKIAVEAQLLAEATAEDEAQAIMDSAEATLATVEELEVPETAKTVVEGTTKRTRRTKAEMAADKAGE